MIKPMVRIDDEVPGFSDRADPAWIAGGRVPSLDGFRGISILLVLWHHIGIQYIYRWPAWMQQTYNTGNIGVDVFFVISGFLISLILLRELDRTGTISIKAFYSRRFFRIVPAYVTYLMIVGGAISFTSLRLQASQWLCLITFTTSLTKFRSWYFAHFWSLSVEEFFYLVWPFLLLQCSRRWPIVISIGYTFFAVFLRIFFRRLPGFTLDQEFFAPTRADAIAAGCALAIVARSSHRQLLLVPQKVAMRVALCSFAVLVAGYAIYDQTFRFSGYFTLFFYRFVVEWCVGLIVWAGVYHPKSKLGCVLNWRPLTAIGALSYSLYLWQQPFLGPMRPTWMFRMPGSLLVILILASASFCFVEQPFIRLKARLDRRRALEKQLPTSRTQTP